MLNSLAPDVFITHVPSIFLCSLDLLFEDVIRSSTMHYTLHHLYAYILCMLYSYLSFSKYSANYQRFCGTGPSGFSFQFSFDKSVHNILGQVCSHYVSKIIMHKASCYKSFSRSPCNRRGSKLVPQYPQYISL